jgi:hypothetical protein
MSIDWDAMRKEMSPIKDYAELRKRWQDAFAYPFVNETYNFTMLEIADYTLRLLGEDIRSRYTEYAQRLIETFHRLHRAGVRDILDFVRQIDTCEQFEIFTKQTRANERDVIAVLKYLVYWFIPTKKLLSGLVDKSLPINHAVQVLRGLGIRTNLDLLQQGLTPANRKAMADTSGLPEAEIDELVNRADFSRMPWASKATISNILGAGYGSLVKLANADPEQLYQDFFRYGASIGKNLKLGNEIESSYRIAKIMPLIIE